MDYEIGIVGKPNSGKTTFFSSLTMIDAKIQNFPFTTIEPNIGIAYYKTPCPHIEIKKSCNPKDSLCRDGFRYIPIKITDVAGIIPMAHEGRGLGLKFLDDISKCDVLLQIIDGSGTTDLEGNILESDPSKEISFLKNELKHWLIRIIKRNWRKINNEKTFIEFFSNLKYNKEKVKKIIENIRINHQNIELIAEKLVECKPIIVIANKMDISLKYKNILKNKVKFFISAMYEKILKKADEKNIIKYCPGDKTFHIKNANKEQEKALEKISKFLKENNGTQVQDVINYVIEKELDLIDVYPVENEVKWSDRKGNILPNAILLKNKSPIIKLAEKIHTDIAKNFLYAIDARKKTRIGKEYKLKKADIIKIIHTSK